MPLIVITRLRLRDPGLFDQFFSAAVAVMEQATSSAGNLGADVLADANNTYWTRTAWLHRSAIDAFVSAEPHLATMGRIASWCDEATFVDWEQVTADLPDWQAAYDRLVAEGKSAHLSDGTEAHQTRAFPRPAVATS